MLTRVGLEECICEKVSLRVATAGLQLLNNNQHCMLGHYPETRSSSLPGISCFVTRASLMSSVDTRLRAKVLACVEVVREHYRCEIKSL